MKKLILSTLFLSILLPSIAQVNAYFDHNPVWHVEKRSYSGSDCSGVKDSRIYTLGGDTLINALTYKKVMKHGVLTIINTSCVETSTSSYNEIAPAFYLRSLAKKMYIYLLSEAQEYLLYDFDLTVGDTLPESYTYNPNQDGLMVVAAIDSILTPNGYMKRFSIAGEDYALFEGAGSTGGLDEPVFPLFLSGFHSLLCYSLEDTTYFPEFTTGTCFSGVGLGELITQQAHVFPNPFINETTIQLSQHTNHANFSLHTINGTVLYNQQFSGDSVTFKRSELPAGVYFYTITEENQLTVSGRVVIQ